MSAASRGDCSTEITAPEQGAPIESNDITEASGLAASWRNAGVFWTHNDGPREKIFAVNMAGQLLATFKTDQSLDDVEDIAVGPGPSEGVSYLYIGDIGSNDSSRDEVRIVRVPEPAVGPETPRKTIDFEGEEVFKLKYASGKYDAETLLVDPAGRQLFVVTKEKGGAHLFGVALEALTTESKVVMEELAQLGFARASGGSISRDGRWAALRREDAGALWRRNDGESVLEALKRPASDLPVVGPPAEPNGEGVTFLADASGYATLSEGEHPPLYVFKFTAGSGQAVFSTPPRVADGIVQIEVAACAGRVVTIQRSGDLIQWEAAETFTAGNSPYTFSEGQGDAYRFYRLSSP